MARVKMNAKHEYEYIANFKVMQTAFKTKRIDKVRSTATLSLGESHLLRAAYTCRKACEMQNAVRPYPPIG
jgi:hypothetical protein